MTTWLQDILQKLRHFGQRVPWRHRRGRRGERLAARWLRRELGWSIVARNWRAGKGELDLVARTPGGQLVFVEVRGRAAHALVGGYHSVTAHKRRILRRTCEAYLRRLRAPPPSWRFDIIEIEWHAGGQAEIRHHPHARL
ncbi:MAG: YraN family protein [Opitutales bacterium]